MLRIIAAISRVWLFPSLVLFSNVAGLTPWLFQGRVGTTLAETRDNTQMARDRVRSFVACTSKTSYSSNFLSMYRSSFQTCTGDANCGVDREPVHVDADHECRLPNRTCNECGLRDPNAHSSRFLGGTTHPCTCALLPSLHRCFPTRASHSSRHNYIILRLVDVSSLPPYVSLGHRDISS